MKKKTGGVKKAPVTDPQTVSASPAETGTPPSKKPKRLSRSEQWAQACQQVRDGLEALRDLKMEYEEWRDNVPDSLQGGETYQKLEAICDLDLDSIESTIDEAEGLDLPQGFGRD